MKKYWKIFQNHLQTSLSYRANILGSIIYEVIAASSIMILWLAILKNQKTVGTYTFQTLLFYYALAPFVGGLTHVSLSEKLGEEIRYGNFSTQLLRPMSIWTSAFFQEIAYKLNYIATIAPVYALITIALFFTSPIFSINLATIILGILFCGLGFFLHVFFDFMLSWGAFWLTDIWCFRHVKKIFFSIFGGRRFPLDFFTGNLYLLMEFLPFKFIFFLPLTYFLGLRKSTSIAPDLVSWLLWSTAFLFAGYVLWRKGVKKYEAFGS